MRFLYFLLLCFCLSTGLHAQTVVINTGTPGTPEYAVGPVYMSPTLFYRASRYAYLYTQSEMAAAGIPTGASITVVGWMKNNSASSLLGGNFRIYMKNSSATAYSNATETWTNLNAGTTMVYENLSQIIPATANPTYIPFTLNTPFTYTGGSLEISAEWDATGSTGTLASGSFDWVWSTVTDRIYGNGGSTQSNTLSSTSNNTTINDRRPFIQITYVPGNACTNPPTPGAATANNTGPVCPGTAVLLNLNGNSTGSGLTYEWERSSGNAPFTPVSISSPAASASFTINPTATGWYRAKIICNSSTPVYSTPVQVQVSTGLPGGTYSINNGSPTGGTNYNSFADAIAAMNCGITGPVVFNVAPASGPYTETITFGNITGSSAVNTIRFNGNGRTVQFNNTATERQLLTLNGTRYLTIDSLNFTAQNATYGWGALITNAAAYDSITRCSFDLTAISSTTAANVNGIVFSASNTAAATAGINGTRCYIARNYLKGPNGTGGMNYGIGIAAGGNDSNIIRGNIIENYYNNGIYVSTAKGTMIENNTIHRSNKTASVIASEAISTVTGDMSGSRITGNRIYSPAGTTTNTTVFRGLSLLGDGTAADPVIVANNIVYNMNQGGASSGIYLSAALYNKVYHNTVTLDQVLTGTAANYGIYATGTNTGTEIKNNNVSITEGTGGIKYGFYYNTAPSIADAQKNNIYVNSNQAGVQNYGYYTSAYVSQAAFQLANPTLETGSLSVNPQFSNAATGNLLPLNPALNGNGVTLSTVVPMDIAGVLRGVFPTPGAFEIPAMEGPDAGIVALISPVPVFCPGQQPVSVSVINSGTERLTSFQVHWSVNNIPQSPFTFSGLLDTVGGTGQYLDTLTLGNANIPSGANSIRAWIVLNDDMNGLNDTLSITNVQPATFTVSASAGTICNMGNIDLSLAPAAGYTAGMLQWQSSADGVTFTPIANTDNVTYTATGISSNRHYRVFINSGSTGCYSNTASVTVVAPLITAVQDSFHCGPGTVQLHAAATPGAVIDWYAAASGGTSLSTGSVFTTPALSTTTTYYAQASVGGGVGTVGPETPASVGTNSGTSSAITTYHMAFDVLTPTTLVSVDIFPTAAIGSTGSIVIQDNTLATIATIPYTTTVTGGATAQTVTMNIPLPAGTGYRMGQLAPAIALSRNSAGASYPYTSSAINIISNNFGAAYYYYFYNWKFSSGCESPRVPVEAAINSIPLVTLGPDQAVCTDGSATQTLDAGTFTNAAYLWDNNSTTQTRTVNATGTFSVKVTQDGCSARDTIQVVFNPNPVVDLGNDTATCEGISLLLDAGNPGSTYLWNDATTSSTKTASTSGTYYVTVTDANSCSGSDTLILVQHPSPVVNLGNDTAICSGTSLTLNAGNTGADFLWDDGSTNQTRDVTAEGNYFVTVSESGCGRTDSIHITYVRDPVADAINATYGDSATYTFYPINVQHATNFTWNFGDNTPEVTGFMVQHTYAYNGIYTVTLTLDGNCAGVFENVSRTVDVFDALGNGTGITDKVRDHQWKLYPNPARNFIILENKTGITMTGAEVYTLTGQRLYSHSAPASRLQIDIKGWAAGIYFVKVATPYGFVIRKFEILP